MISTAMKGKERMAANLDLCQICKAPIPQQIKAATNRKYCPSCFSVITRQGLQEAMKTRGSMSAEEADQKINESDIRNLAAGLIAPEDFADIYEKSDTSTVAQRLYQRTKFTDKNRQSEITNILTKWVLDMKETAFQMNLKRCCECLAAFKQEDRLEISLSPEERKLLDTLQLVICRTDYDTIINKRDRAKAMSSVKGYVDFNKLSTSQAIMLGGLSPYDTPSWVTANPECWKYIHQQQEHLFIGKLKHGDLVFMGNDVAHGGENG